MGRRRFRNPPFAVTLALGLLVVAATTLVPCLLLLRADEETLQRWSQIGEALSVIGVFFSGIAFLVIAAALLIQQRELVHQHEELKLVREEHRRNSEISLRQLHMDVIRMALNDRDLLTVWPQPSGWAASRKKHHYCNLILNLQKVAYEAGTIDADELRNSLRHLMQSRDMYAFWQHARATRVAVTGSDEAENFFTAQVDLAFEEATPPDSGLLPDLRRAARSWLAGGRFRL